MGCQKITYYNEDKPLETFRKNLKVVYAKTGINEKKALNYSTFGSLLPGRYTGGNQYRYTFQGQESDPEIKGEGNSINFKYRMHDPRLGKFFAIDPLTKMYPHNSPYAFSENRVIDGIELEGLEVVHFMNTGKKHNISKMTEKQVKKLFKENNVRFDSDWLDVEAVTEHWSVGSHKDTWGNSTGTLIEKYSSEKSYNKKGAKPYFAEWDRNFAEWLAATDNQLFGTDGVGKGVALMAATWGTLLSGGTLAMAEGVAATGFATVGFVLSADEMTQSPEGNTLLELLTAEMDAEKGPELLKGAKLAFDFKNAAKGVVNITTTLVSGKTVTGAYDYINNVYDITKTTVGVVNNKSEKKKGEK